jgi:hypothetical protein
VVTRVGRMVLVAHGVAFNICRAETLSEFTVVTRVGRGGPSP